MSMLHGNHLLRTRRQIDFVAFYGVDGNRMTFSVIVRDEVGRCDALTDVYEIVLSEDEDPRQVLLAAICRELDRVPPPLGIPKPPMPLQQQLHLVRNGGWPAGVPFLSEAERS
jgi:hypothetical protein